METFVKKLVSGLNKEELRHLRISSNRYDLDSAGRKDFKLIDYILRKGDDYNDDEIAEKLYGDTGKNSFYRLKNRVNDMVEKSLLDLNYGKDPHNHCLSYIQLYHHFHRRNKLDIAVKYLEKAEKLALGISANDLLDIIYTEFIKLAYDRSENPEYYIEKRQQCRQRMLELQQIDDVLALLKYRIQTTQNLVRKDNQVSGLMERTLKQVTGKKTANNPELYFKIYESVSRILLNNNDFKRLEKYLLTTYEECIRMKLFNRQNHNVKLQMLTYLVNTLFTLDKYNESLHYAEVLRRSMDEFGKQHRPAFIFYYYNSLANNYTRLGKSAKAVEYILQGLEDGDIAANDLHSMYLHLQLCIQQFDLREFRNSLRFIQKIYLNRQFNTLDSGFRFKIHIIECLNRYEQKDFDVLEKNLRNLRKRFDNEYRDPQMNNQKVILNLLTALVKEFSGPDQGKIRFLAAGALEEIGMQQQASDLINYAEWLKASFKI